jgi:Protein of unknown function (DUF4242)
MVVHTATCGLPGSLANSERARERGRLRLRTTPKGPEMKTYAIRRERAWSSPAELEQSAARSTEVANREFPNEIRWIRSYVIAEDDGSVGTVCIYQAPDAEAIRRHASRVGMPADHVLDVSELVVVRPDPEPHTAA